MNNSRIALLSLETGEYRVLFEGGSFARYVPTGHVVFAREDMLLAAPFDLQRLEPTGEPVPILEDVLTESMYGAAHFDFAEDGTLVYVSRVTSERALVWVDRSGAVDPIPIPAQVFEDPRLSPDGRKLAVTIRGAGLHIWVYEFSRDALTRLTFGGTEETPAWSPDGGRLVFHAGYPPNLFYQSADGSGTAERLSTAAGGQVPTSWSPDGNVLVYHERNPETDSHDIWMMELDDEKTARPFLQTPFHEAGGVISPDGRFLAYHSNESGQWEVYVRPFPGPGGKWQGRPSLLFEQPFAMPDVAFAEYDVAPDGERFVMLQESETWPTQIHVVLNWFEELKARVPTRSR